MTSFEHSKPCQKTMHIYASLSLIISLIKLMSINYAYNNKKNLTWIFMKGTGCYSARVDGGDTHLLLSKSSTTGGSTPLRTNAGGFVLPKTDLGGFILSEVDV